MTTPFDYIKSINEHAYMDDISGYVPFVINRGLSFSMDTILYANQVNQFPGLDLKMQYDYLFGSIRPRRRYTKWIKNTQTAANELEAVQSYYGFNREKARQAMMILTDEQLETIRNELINGG